MKKTIIILSLFTFFGCNDEFYESLNTDTTNPSDVPASFLLTSATTSLFDQMTDTNVNRNVFRLFAQYWTETQYTDETNYDLTKREIPGNHWGELYRDVLYDLKDAKSKVEEDATLSAAEQSNQLAIIDILSVYTWQVLVDTFGNVPYTEALEGLENTTPVYDDAATIYNDLITRITEDINTIDTSAAGFGDDDIIYSGNMSAWKKLAATIKLKIGVQLSDVNTSLATTTITEAISAGIFESNSDNFVMTYLSTDPYQNPVAVALNERNDFVSANTVVDMMNDLSDPRRPIYFKQNMGTDTYVGGVYGAGVAFSDATQIGDLMYEYETPGDLLDYAEVEFMLAEAVAKGISVGGTVESHYNAGVKASMEYWGVSTTDADTYLASSDVAFSSASGTDLEKIASQFWIAMYNRGFSGWNVWRRLDAPTLASPAPISNLPVPLRYTYPVDEKTLNKTNYEAAAQAIGGDEQQTRVFWDVR